MIAVADASPFIVLVNVGHIDLLPSLFGRIVTPPEVVSELGSPKRSAAVRAFAAALPAWLEVLTPVSPRPIPGLQAGETAAIALTLELGADRLVIDEARGRRAAAGRGIRVIGTVGVLEAAAQRRLINLEHVFELVRRTDFWVAHDFLDERLALFYEWERSNPPPG